MATFEELKNSVDNLTNTIIAVDAKLDEVAAFIATLKAGTVTQEQLDSLASQVSAAQASAEAVLGEADSLDNQ